MIVSEMLVLIRNSKGELVWYLPSFNCTAGLVTPEEAFDKFKLQQSAIKCAYDVVAKSNSWGEAMNVYTGLLRTRKYLHVYGLTEDNVITHLTVNLEKKDDTNGNK